MFNFKKVASVFATTVLVGATAGFAAAASYPAPFVENGAADVAIVYGSTAPAPTVDLVAVLDIQNNLSPLVTGTSGATTVDCEEGENCVMIAKSSDNLNVGNGWEVFTGSVDDDDLSTLLADGTYVASDNDDFDYEQKVNLGNASFSHFRDSDYESLAGLDGKTPTLGFKISSNTHIMNYTLDFTQDAETTVATDEVTDIEGSDLPLLGKTYYVSDFKNGTSVTYFGKLTLLDSANVATVAEGETVSVAVGDQTYQVAINYIDSDEVRYEVDGVLVPSTGKLNQGETAKISDNVFIGARTIDKLEVSGEIGITSFSIGTGKLEITSASDVKLNSESIQGLKGYVYRGTASGSSEKVNKIVLEWTTDEEEFLSPEAEFIMPGFEAMKFTMNDFVRPEEERVTIEKDSDTSVQITAPIKDGDVSFNLLYANASGDFIGLGKAADDRLATASGATLTFQEKDSGGDDYHSYFVATYKIAKEAESYLLRAKVSEDTSNARNETTIEKYTNSDGWTAICEEKVATDSCDMGDVSLTITEVNYTSGALESVVFTRGSSDVSFNMLYTTGGLGIYLPYEALNASTTGLINFTAPTASHITGHSWDSFYLAMDGEDKDDTLLGGVEFQFTINDNADNNLQIQQINSTGGGAGTGTGGENGLEIGDSSTYEAYVRDDVAPRILHYTQPDEDWAEIYYPTGDSESYAEVFLTDSSTTSSTSSNILTLMDSGAVPTDKNLIVVGGTCVNSVAQQLLSASGPLCGSAWTSATGVGDGEYLIQTFSWGTGNVATLVAGYNQGDTANAATALITQDVTTDAGTKYTGTTATAITPVTV